MISLSDTTTDSLSNYLFSPKSVWLTWVFVPSELCDVTTHITMTQYYKNLFNTPDSGESI